MATTYHPKRAYFSSNRIQLIGKEVLKECAEDRQRALETFKYFQEKVEVDPCDDKSKTEMIHALELSMAANDKKVKVLDFMIKLAMHQDKIAPRTKDIPMEDLSFDQIKKTLS